MKLSLMRQRLKPWLLPAAMATGIMFHDFMKHVEFLAPYLIFAMLLITFCKVTPKEFKATQFSWLLLSVQIIGALTVYSILITFSNDIAQGAFICIFCPTATAAPVITGMLGGNVPRLATFSIISNISVAILSPVIFTFMSPDRDISFFDTFSTISLKMTPLLLLPLVLALSMLKFAPRIHKAISQKQSISFYIWAISLFIVVGRAVSFIMDEPSQAIPEMTVLAILSGIICCGQFYIGRKLGNYCGDKIAGAQGLGQKNTVLAIWMSITYLQPITSIAPAAYIAWQNTINSIQLYIKAKRSH